MLHRNDIFWGMQIYEDKEWTNNLKRTNRPDWPDPAPTGQTPESLEFSIKIVLETGPIRLRPARAPESFNS